MPHHPYQECIISSIPESIPLQRFIAIDSHKHYVMVGGMNHQRQWVLRPRKVSMARFRDWATKNLKPDDRVILETTSNVWDLHDIVSPLVSKTLVANAYKVRQIAEARVKTDKEDVKRLLTLLIANIVPDVWVPPIHVRELRALISFRSRIGKQLTTLAPAVKVQVCPRTVFTVLFNVSISSLPMANSWLTKISPGGTSKISANSPIFKFSSISKSSLTWKLRRPRLINSWPCSVTPNPGPMIWSFLCKSPALACSLP